jgi:mercuric ion transport protein
VEHYSASRVVESAAARTGGGTDSGKSVSANAPLTGGVIAGLAASICCLGPLVLVALGLGGAAAGLIEFFTPLRPVFVGLALLFLGFAAYRLFFVPRVCAPGTACADPRTLRNQRLLFIGAVIVVAALVAFPWYVVYLT